MHFNMHVLNNVIFGCSGVHFNAKQTNELKRIYELPMIRKLGLRDNFPRELLHAQKSILVIGLIEPNIMIDMLAIPLYVGNKLL